ncbi:TPA: GTPase ObgE [bacterium]|nr:GTPase ObgE [bacterium]
MFVDELEIKIQAGKGGDGAVSLHHEKYRPRGGPDGGDGGRGGDVIFEVDPSLNTLSHLAKGGQIFKAEDGKKGGKNNCTGQDGRPLIIKVPLGTEVIDFNENVKIADLVLAEASVIAACGAPGGKGNARFATPTNQTPRKAEKGKTTEPKRILLRFKLVADIGLVGYPNTGKSTLLAQLTFAKPKIADYPFTTLNPNLGIMQTDEFSSYTLIDLPAIIEGAHQGHGLGNRFLQHLERAKILIHLLDATQDPPAQFDLLNKELSLYHNSLDRLPQLVVANKIDLVEDQERLDEIRDSLGLRGYESIFVSALKGRGLDELKERIAKTLNKEQG